MAKDQDTINALLAVSSAISDQSRVRLLMALRKGPLCVCQLIELLGFTGATVSRHLSILKQAGLVDSEKRGRWVYYSLKLQGACCDPVTGIMRWLNETLHCDALIKADEAKMKNILKLDPEELCRRQCKS